MKFGDVVFGNGKLQDGVGHLFKILIFQRVFFTCLAFMNRLGCQSEAVLIHLKT